jgi:hypothetical protein
MYIFILIALFITIILYFTVVDNSIFSFADNKKKPVKIKHTQPVKKKPLAPIHITPKKAPIHIITPKKPKAPLVTPQKKPIFVQKPIIIKGIIKPQPIPLVHNIITSYISRDDNALKTNVNTFKNQYSVFKATQLTTCNTNNPTIDDIICNLKFQYKLQSFI